MIFFIHMLYQLFLRSVAKMLSINDSRRFVMVSEGLPVLAGSLTVGQKPQQWRHVRTLYSPLDRQRTESSQEPSARYERDKSATIYSFHPLNISKIKSWGPSIQIACGGKLHHRHNRQPFKVLPL